MKVWILWCNGSECALQLDPLVWDDIMDYVRSGDIRALVVL